MAGIIEAVVRVVCTDHAHIVSDLSLKTHHEPGRVKRRDEQSLKLTTWHAHKWGLQSLVCYAGIGCCVAMSIPQIHIVPHPIDRGFTAQDGANMLALMLGCGIISRIVSGMLSDRIGGTRTLAPRSFLQIAVLAAFLFVDGLPGLYLVSIAFGLSQGGIVPSYAILIRRFFRPSEAGTRIGLVFVFTVLGMALGGWMAGILFDLTGSYTASFMNAIAFNIANLMMGGFILWRDRLATAAR